MAAPGGFSYKPNVNRAVTKKWKDANPVNYDGEDYAEEDEYEYEEPPAPVSAGNARHPAWGAQGQIHPANRSLTNPSPPRAGGRPSFDRGDERRYFSGGSGGFDSAYPSTQRTPFPEPQHDFDQPQNFRAPPPLQVHTQGQGPYPPSFRPSSRGQQRPPHPNAPFSAPGGYPRSRSGSGNRSNPGDMYQRRESPVRPDSQTSNTSTKHFPPRKSSLSQQQPPADIPMASHEFAEHSPAPTPPAGGVKALPFIRPSDIYKRMEEEREKERRSQESSRPSLDLNTGRTRDSSTSARSATSETTAAPAEDTDSARRLKPTPLDTVVERKSEYGFDNMMKAADPSHPSVQSQDGNVNRRPTNASSVYTDRPDPISASTDSRNDSPQSMGRQDESYSPPSYQHNLPSLGNVSSFDSNVGSSFTPAATNKINAPEHPPPAVPEKDSRTGLGLAGQSGDESLSHQPSLGYRSVVEQAFDQSQNQQPLSPTSGHGSLPRSNSASTSEISPIISRHQDLPHGPSGPPVTERPIPEEPIFGHSRVLSDSTIRAGESPTRETSLPAPPVIQSGFRRDRTPPSRDNSPAKQPLSVQTGHPAGPSHGVVGSTEDVRQQVQDEKIRGRSGPAPPAPSAGSFGAGDVMSPQSNHSTTSEEYKEWQDQKNQFNARFGIQDSNPTTPGVPSPSSRSGSPPKGSVRDLAGKYESNSGPNTPTNTGPADYLNARPAPQFRQESFRPQIPGGWQSSTATPRLETPSQDSSTLSQPSRLGDMSRFESTDSIPTAKAPSNWQEEQEGTARTAFAAVAAAGTALAGAFSGTAFSRPRDDSPQRSEDSWERSAVSSIHAPDSSDTRDFGAAQEDNLLNLAPPTQVSLPPTPLPKDSPIPTPEPVKVAANTLRNESTESGHEPSTIDYFPAPLRTNKSIDLHDSMRPPIPHIQQTENSPTDRDNDQLQRDIVKSLTPKSSNVEAQPEQHTSHQTPALRDQTDYTDFTSDRQAVTGHERPPASATVDTHSGSTDSPLRPFLEQRFSWEMDPEGAAASPYSPTAPTRPPFDTPSKAANPSTQSPDTERAERASTETPAAEPREVSSPKSASTTRPISGEEIVAPPTILKDIGPSPSLPATIPGPHAELPFRKILAMGSQQQRIQAFTDSRESYKHSDGLLDQWILSMQTPEHADIFQSNGLFRQGAGGGQNTAHRPSPNRPLPSMTGSKLMPEDGKKLMEASKRFGGKAGGAAKGLFAKGKDKWRSVSAGDKGLLTSRRKSTGDVLESNEPETSKRDSTFLAAPPQIPAQDLHSSPIDGGSLFSSERDKQNGQPTVTESNTTETNRFSIVSKDSALDRDGGLEDTRTRPKSPPISILSRPGTSQPEDDGHEAAVDHHDETPAIVEAGATATAIAVPVAIQSESSGHPGDVVEDHPAVQEPDRQEEEPATQPAPSDTLLDVPNNKRVSANEQSLTVPEQRPHSAISNVSSASPSPVNSQEGQNLRRSISPAEPIGQHDEAVPSYRPDIPPTKEEEAAADRRAAESQGLTDTLPPYNPESVASKATERSRIGSDAQIVPVTDLSRQRRQEEIRTTDRPFSFEGSEYINQAIHADEKSQLVHSPPSLPLSPVSQTLSKSMSQVSAEEIIDAQDHGLGKRTSRSYSRPFGADPIKDHPALRQPDQAVDRTPMYPSESPLPSARRPRQDFDDVRRPSPAPVIQTEQEGAYRIPGPHFQELRSPRRNSGQNILPTVHEPQQANDYQQPNGTAHYAPGQFQPQSQPQPQVPSHFQQSVMGPPPPHKVEPPAKKSKFGGLFQTKSKTRLDQEPVVESRSRGKLIKQNSRQNSIRSQHSSVNERRDVVGQLPQPDKSKRRQSRDLMRSSTPTDQHEGKKKRFSAMGNLFSRGTKSEKPGEPQRASTLPTNSAGPSRPHQPGPYSQQYAPAPHDNSMYSRPGQQFLGSPPPPGGYYAPPQQQVANSSAQSQQQYAYEYPQPRPSDLRIDTRGGNQMPPHQAGPATAPPQPHSSRAMSYQSQPDEYRLSSTRVQSPITVTVPPSATGSASRSPDAHVVALHKRSRSPKLGWRPSTEDSRHLAPSNAAGDIHTPVEGLGTFSSKKISPVGGIPRPDQDQEAPFRIDIPGGNLGEEERRRRLRQSTIEKSGIHESDVARATSPTTGQGQTVAERLMGPQLPASGVKVKAQSPTSGNTDGSRRFVAELPGSKAEGYESDDEVVMSATAYPGNWQDPVFFDDGKWDD